MFRTQKRKHIYIYIYVRSSRINQDGVVVLIYEFQSSVCMWVDLEGIS